MSTQLNSIGGTRLRAGGFHSAASEAPHVARRQRIQLACLLIGCAIVTAPLFYCGATQLIESDHHLHIGLIQKGIDTGIWPVHFLFPFAVYVVSGFSRDVAPLSVALTATLTVCFLAKAWLTYGALAGRHSLVPGLPREVSGLRTHATVLLLVSAALLVAAPVVRPWWTNRVYLGQISPNVWHNPTSIVCWPLAIVLFFVADAFLRSGRVRLLVPLGLLSALSVMAKPNYFLAFAPVFGLFALWRFKFSRTLLLSQLVLLPTLLLLAWQLSASFDGEDAMRPERQIAFLPFAAWRIYSDSIVLSLLFSLAFPLSYVVLCRRSLQFRSSLVLAWGVMLSAILWAACFAEVSTVDGAVDNHFNFSWGAHLAIFVLFLVTAMDMLRNPVAMQALRRHASAGWQARVPWWLLGAHAVSGIYWIIRQAAGRGFV